jgi:hypothetical protein
MNRWGSEGPPLEAYSRVTNPERFRPLHGVALTLLEQLHASFNAERVEGYGLDSELESGALARPSVRLIPDDPKAAPLTITFTTFPGLKRSGLAVGAPPGSPRVAAMPATKPPIRRPGVWKKRSMLSWPAGFVRQSR